MSKSNAQGKGTYFGKNRYVKGFGIATLVLLAVYLLFLLPGVVGHIIFEQRNKALLSDFRADAKTIARTYKEDKASLPSWGTSLDELINGDTLREEFRTSSDSNYFYHIVEPKAGEAFSQCDYYIELQKNSPLGEGVETVAKIYSDDCPKQWLTDLVPIPFHLW